MDFKLTNAPDVSPPKPYFSHVQTIPISPTATLITIAGQVGVDFETKTAPPTFAGQVEVALQNLGKCLAVVGATPADIIKTQHFVVNLDPNDTSRAELYTEFMGGHKPPSTLLAVVSLADPSFLYEIEAMAVIHQRS